MYLLYIYATYSLINFLLTDKINKEDLLIHKSGDY